MKNFNLSIAILAAVALLFTSCSKEDESGVGNTDSEKATISFGAILNDLVTNKASSKQAVTDLPECSEDDPAYVEIILLEGDDEVVGTSDDPFRIDLVAGEIFTEEVPELQLDPGTYTLDHFAVYDAEGDLIWLAPRGGVLAEFIDNPLPLSINLGAGVKKYVDVPVLCFDDRDVNEYGYLFFEFNEQQGIEFCIFGNYCPPEEGGRHYPAEFSVDVWLYEDGEVGAQLYDDLSNSVTLNEFGDYAGTPLCVALPDRDGDDSYYVEITLLNSDAYGNVEERVIRQGVITDGEVRGFFDGDDNIDYYHFREGCDGDDGPPIFQEPGDEAVHYKACLYPENGSEVFGFAYFRLLGNELRATVMATNLENGPHAQHIHVNADCDDAGGVLFGLPEEGGGWPEATGAFGNVDYNRIFTLTSEQISDLQNLENRTVNMHGMTVGGEYNAGIVNSCGEIELHQFD